MWDVARRGQKFTSNSKNIMQVDGGWGGIRTHGELAPTAVFKTAALNHSATHPQGIVAARRLSRHSASRASRATEPVSAFPRLWHGIAHEGDQYAFYGACRRCRVGGHSAGRRGGRR